ARPRRGGQRASALAGRSFADVLDAPARPGRHEQYLECVGRGAMYNEGWKAVAPAAPHPADGAAGGPWELYHLPTDPTESTDLAAQYGRRADDLAEQWRTQAWHNTVLPLDDDGSLYTVRPQSEAALARPVRLLPFRPPLERFRSARLTVLRSFQVEAEIELEPGAAGVIMAHGDQGGGYALMIHRGAWTIAYNAYGQMHHGAGGTTEPGHHSIRWRDRKSTRLNSSHVSI